MKKASYLFILLILGAGIFLTAKSTSALSVSSKLKGKILLQVQSYGEAYYVNPKDEKRYYMANGNEAYKIMRYLGIGVTNINLNKIKTDKIFAKKNSGKIFLQVEARGEAYYIDFNGNAHYLKDGAAAYIIMRELGLGITNNDLNKIALASGIGINNPVNSQNNSLLKNCAENWQCNNWSECTWINGKMPAKLRVCNDLNNCGTLVSKPIESQNCCYIKYYDWSDFCMSGKQIRTVDIVGCSDVERSAVISERDCPAGVGTCVDSDGGKNYNVAGITTDIYGAKYPDSCLYGKSLSEWFCNADNTLGYESRTCDYKCENNACVSSPTTCLSGDNYCPSGCLYQQDHDCQCQKDLDCLTGNANSAAKCGDGICINSSISQALQVSGDLTGFCASYINNCAQSVIINLGGTNNLQAQVNGKSAGHTECNIKLLWGDGNYIVDFWVDIGDSLEACMHNVPIYFYHSANTMCGSAPCYGEFP